MIRRFPRTSMLGTVAVILVALAGLLASSLPRRPIRVLSLEVPNQATVVTLGPHQEVCEGPIVSPRAFAGVQMFGAAGGPVSLISQVWNSGHHRLLASGPLIPPSGQWQARLSHRIAAGVPVVVCLRDEAFQFAVSGSGGSRPGFTMTGPGSHGRTIPIPGQEFSLNLLSATTPTLLGALSTAFDRASLWRPSWVGSWTFWLLGAGLIGAFGLALIALLSAFPSEASSGPCEHGDGHPPGPSAGSRQPAEGARVA